MNSNETLISVKVELEKGKHDFIVDSGSAISLISESIINKFSTSAIEPYINIKGISGNEVIIKQAIYLYFNIGNTTFLQRFYVLPEQIQILGILGLDFLHSNKITINFRTQTLHLSNTDSVPINNKVFCLYNSIESIEVEQPKYIYAKMTEVIQPLSHKIIICNRPLWQGNYTIAPLITKDYIFIKDVIWEDSYIFCVCFNPDSIPKIIYDKQRLFKIISESSENNSDSCSNDIPIQSLQEIPSLLIDAQRIDDSIDKSIMGKMRKVVIDLILEFENIFHSPGEKLIPSNYVAPRLQLKPGIVPIKMKPYKLADIEREAVEKVLNGLIEDGILKESVSPWAFPIMAIPKGHKRPDGSHDIRVVADLRKLNQCLLSQNYPLPNISLLINKVKNAKYFSLLDMSKGYYQVKLHPDDQQIVTVVSEFQSLSFGRLPQGLAASPGIFQRFMNETFRSILYKTAVLYLDDLCIYTDTFEQHVAALREAFEIAKKAKLHFNALKCQFFKKSVKLLGFIVDGQTIRMSPDRIKAITELKQPQTIRDLQLFLGKVNFNRIFLPKLAEIAAPLTQLLHKESTLEWTSQCESSFQEIKRMLTSYPILHHYQSDLPLYLFTDSSDVSIGSILAQPEPTNEKQVRVIEYYSKKLTPTQMKWNITLKEFYAVYQSVKHFHCYCYGRPITVFTDHKSIIGKNFASNVRTNKQLLRYALELSSYQLTFQYITSKQNVIADFLSRYNVSTSEYIDYVNKIQNTTTVRPATTPVLNESEISLGQPKHKFSVLCISQDTEHQIPVVSTIIEDNILEQQKIDSFCKRIQMHIQKKGYHDRFMLLDNKIYDVKLGYPRLLLPRLFIKDLLFAYHSSILGGHRSFLPTYKKIYADYYWPTMKRDIYMYIKSCTICQTSKRPIRAPQGKLGTVPYIDIPFHSISIDFMGPIAVPATTGEKSILVSVCLFSKYAEIKGTHTQNAEEVSKFLLERIVTKHGPPQTILSDRGLGFRSQVVTNLLKSLDIKQQLTTAYHPQCNGSVEKLNSTILSILRTMLTKDNMDKWYDLLPYVQYIYNTTPSHPRGLSPFEIVYGRKPPPIMNLYENEARTFNRAEQLRHLPMLRTLVKERIETERIKVKRRYDRDKKNTKYYPGDLVLIYQPAIPTSTTKKFVKKWGGPAVIKRELSYLNYEVYLPQTNTVRVFNIERLKLFIPPLGDDYYDNDDEILKEYNEKEILAIFRDFLKYNSGTEILKGTLERNRIEFLEEIDTYEESYKRALHYNMKREKLLNARFRLTMEENTLYIVIGSDIKQHPCWQQMQEYSTDFETVHMSDMFREDIIARAIDTGKNKHVIVINQPSDKQTLHLMISIIVNWIFQKEKIRFKYISIFSDKETFLLVVYIMQIISEMLHNGVILAPLEIINFLGRKEKVYLGNILATIYIVYRYLATTQVELLQEQKNLFTHVPEEVLQDTEPVICQPANQDLSSHSLDSDGETPTNSDEENNSRTISAIENSDDAILSQSSNSSILDQSLPSQAIHHSNVVEQLPAVQHLDTGYTTRTGRVSKLPAYLKDFVPK